MGLLYARSSRYIQHLRLRFCNINSVCSQFSLYDVCISNFLLLLTWSLLLQSWAQRPGSYNWGWPQSGWGCRRWPGGIDQGGCWTGWGSADGKTCNKRNKISNNLEYEEKRTEFLICEKHTDSTHPWTQPNSKPLQFDCWANQFFYLNTSDQWHLVKWWPPEGVNPTVGREPRKQGRTGEMTLCLYLSIYPNTYTHIQPVITYPVHGYYSHEKPGIGSAPY